MTEIRDTISSPAGSTSRPHRSKAVAGALALVAGWAGAHRLYLGSRFWWLYPLFALPAMGIALAVGGEHWYRHPGFFLAALVQLIAMFEAIGICLTPDPKWDIRHNSGSGGHSANGWPAVLIAIVALFLGALLLMSVMAIALEGYFLSVKSIS